MQEKPSIFERFPYFPPLNIINNYLSITGLPWERVEGDTCLRVKYSKEANSILINSELGKRTPSLFKERNENGKRYIYTSVLQLGKEIFGEETDQFVSLQRYVYQFHLDQITPGQIDNFILANYQTAHKAYSAIAFHELEKRHCNGKPSFFTKTLLPGNAVQLAGIFREYGGLQQCTIKESGVNPGFFRVIIDEGEAEAQLMRAREAEKSETLSQESITLSYSHNGYMAGALPASQAQPLVYSFLEEQDFPQGKYIPPDGTEPYYLRREMQFSPLNFSYAPGMPNYPSPSIGASDNGSKKEIPANSPPGARSWIERVEPHKKERASSPGIAPPSPPRTQKTWGECIVDTMHLLFEDDRKGNGR